MLKINYVIRDGEVIQTSLTMEHQGMDAWLNYMIKDNPEAIFFLTTETTDVCWTDL